MSMGALRLTAWQATWMDWEAEGLLDGVEDGAREGRRRLLDELHADGVDVETLRRAVEEDRLVLMPIERSLMGSTELTARDVADRAGVDLEFLTAVQRAVGMPVDLEERAYGDEDVEAARRVKAYVDAGLPRTELLGLLRVVSSSVGRAAEAMREVFAGAYLEPDIDEYTLGRRYGEMTRALMPLATADLDFLLRVHLREHSRRDAVGFTERREGSLPRTRDVAVAFADLVGFTKLGEEVESERLSGIADRLEELARDAVRPPVRLVKTIGDAVMLVSPEPGPLLDTLLDLVDAAEADEDLPTLRAGAAWGPAMPRMGDWYGGTVNLASRLTGRARPGSVLADAALKELAGDRYDWSHAGQKKLKGVSENVDAWRARRK
jgi:adenylate cyclase